MQLCLADLPEKPVWTADEILQATDNQLESYEAVYRAALRFSRAWLRGEELFHLQTSGSTGIPKPITVSRRQMLASIHGTAATLQLHSGQSALVCLNPAYIAGIMMLARGWEIGLHMDLVAPSSHPLQNFTTETGFDFVAMVPLQLQQSLENEPDKSVLDRCGKVIIGGAAMSAELERAAQQTRAAVYATFGMTETVSHIALRRVNGTSPETAYRLLPGITAQTDERSCLMLKGEVTDNQWVYTNDVITFTQADCFRFEGRADFVINSGGVKIFPEQLEQEIQRLQLPELSGKRFIISSLPDERLGERVVLIVETDTELSATYLLQYLKEKLPRYHAPQRIFCLPQFPETATGKVSRREVQKTIDSM
ncbi:AMP-binding protein [Rhodoflexus caldus]|uniref:AMP-binding protein n=1 Tax=Rhodoflexus caldus TaxID=2891236 RepID=UPI00202A2395|nr:AMP-binding protein [Rhodoflexus caldus]